MSSREALRDPVVRREIWEYSARVDALLWELSSYVPAALLALPRELVHSNESWLALEMAARAVVSEGARVPGGLLFDLVRHVPPQEADMPGDLLSYTAYGTGRSSETGWAAGYAAPGRRIVLAEFWTTSDEFVVEPAVERHGASVCVTWPVGDEGRNEKFEFTGVEWLRVVPAVECMIWDIQDAYDRLVEVVPDVALSDLPGVIGPSDGGRLFLMCLGGFGAVKVVARSWSRTG